MPDQQQAAKAAEVEKGLGKDGNEKDSSRVEVPDEMEVSKSSGRKGKSSSKSAHEKISFDDEEAKIEDLILAECSIL